MQPSQPLPLSQIGKLKSAASSSNPLGGILVTTSAPSSRPGTAEERRKELHKTLRDRHTPQHRLHFFGRPGSSGTTRPHQGATSGGAESPDVGLEGPTWSNASLVNTQSLAARVEETDNVQLSPSQRHMSKQMRALADRTAKAEADAATQEHMQQLFEGLPWWRRIVVDENFRRRVATLAARAIRAQEGYHRPDAEAQNISLPPMFRWEAMSAENRVVQPTPGASCGPLDGVTHRWKGPFPPNGFVQLTPNVLNLRATAEKKGPLHINVYVPMRPKRQPHHASDLEDFDGTHALDELGGVRGDGMEHRTIGQMILDYEDAQRRKFELEMEAKRQQREAALNGGAGGSNGGMGGTRGKLAMDDEGFLTIDGVRLEQRYVGTLRPSFLLLRWRIICNAIHEYGASVSGLGVGRPGFGVAASPGAQQASPILPSSAASMFGGSMPGSAPGTPRRAVKWNLSNNNNSSTPASVAHGVQDALELQQQQSMMTTSPSTPQAATGASSTPSWLEGLPKFGVPVFAVEARPARNVYDQSTDKRRVEAYPPSKISGAFTSIRREDIPESRRQFLFQAPGCRKAVHRLFQELHQDATGRIHQAAYVEFMLDLLHVFLPTFHAQSNIEVAEDEWLCRGVPEFPDFTIFYRNLFDFPLILCRERNTMTEEQYISVWDLLYEALYGREKLLGWYEVDIKRTQLLMGLPAPTTNYAAVRSSSPSAVLGGSSSVAANNADALSWKAHLPSYLCPTSPESAIEVPLRKNADHYALHRVATHIESTHQQVQLSDPARRTFLIHRLASTHLANRTHQEGKSGDLSPAASFRLAAAASAGRRRNRKMEGGVDAEDNNDDDDDYLASPLLEGGGDGGVQFPSLALQVKQLADREKKAATSPVARGQRGKLHKTERQREEARRINEMLAIENKASSLNLYEEVYESPEMPRDDIDEILDYCSEISDTDLVDGSGEEEDLDEDEMIPSLDSAGGVPLDPHDAEVAAVAAAKAAAAARRKRSIRALYHEARHQRELRAEREAQEALEAKLLQQRRAALQQKQQRLSPPDLSLSGMSGRRRLSSISPTKPAALRRTSLVAQIAGNSKLGINTARSDDGQTQLSLSGRAPSPTSHKDSEIPVTSGGGNGPSGALSTSDAAGTHDPRTKMVLSPEHAQRVRRAERERVRQLALPNGNELVPTSSPSAPTPLVPPVAVPLQYRTFLASHLTSGARTALDASEPQLIHTTPQQQKSGARRLPPGWGGSQQHQRRPETAMSAHASLSVNPFQRLSRQTKSLIEATPQGGKSRQAVDGGADWSSAEQADPQLMTEDPNSLGTANGTPHRQKQQSNGQRPQHVIPRPYGSAGVVGATHHIQSTPPLRHVAAVSSIPRFSSRPASGESFSSTPSSMIGGVQRILLTPAQSQAHDEKRRELLALLMLDQQQEVIGGGHAAGGGELQGLQAPTGGVDDPFEIQSRPSTNHGGRNSSIQLHFAQHPTSADQQDMHQSNNECSMRQQHNHDESVVDEGGSFPTDFPKEGLETFGALSFNSSPNGGNNTVPRRPRMPSFVRHNNQTKMRTVLGDLQTSVLASVTTPPSHPISRSGSKTATPVNNDMPSSTVVAAQRGGSASGARRLTNFTTPHQQSSAGTMPPPGGVVPSIRQLPPPSGGEGAPPDGSTMVRHVVAGNPPTTITPLNGFMQRSQTIAVTPIRPPKYRYPKFKGPQGPPEKLYVNGHLVVGQHPTLALVQRLNLGVPLSKEQQARQDQKPSSPTTQKGNAQGPLSPTTTATGNGEETSSPHALLPNLPLQGLAHAFPTTTTTTSTPRGASADMVTPRPLGMGVRSPRTVLATELERTVIVVPTGSGRWDANEASQSLRGGRSTSKQRHSPTATTTAARGAAGELSFSLESVLNITEIPI